MNLVDNILAKTEQFFNPIDKIPIATSFTGMIRILAGGVEVVAGIVFGTLSALFSSSTYQKQAFKQGCIYSLHGIGNIARGSICMIPFVNISLYLYDAKIGRMNYPNETMNYDVYPLMTAYLVVNQY